VARQAERERPVLAFDRHREQRETAGVGDVESDAAAAEGRVGAPGRGQEEQAAAVVVAGAERGVQRRAAGAGAALELGGRARLRQEDAQLAVGGV